MRDRGLLHLDGLEATLERGVLLQVLAVLVAGGGADGLQLTAREHGLQDGGRVDGALGGARAHERVQLVDEQHDVAAGLDLLQHLLETLLEVTAVARAGHERAEVQRVDLLALERLGHLALHDGLAESLDDGGLADAGLADQHGVVLGAARKHLHHALDLLLAPDDRIELLIARELREVAAELVQHHGTLRAALALRPAAGRGLALAAGVAGEQLDHGLADAIQIGPELLQDLRGDALALADQPEQDVLGADVVVTELQGLAQRELQHLLGAGREGDVSGGGRLPLADDLFDLLAHGLERDVQRLERLGGDALALVDQPEQDVLGADVVVVEHPRLFLGENHNPSGSIGETFEHVSVLRAATRKSVLEDQRTTSYPRGASGAASGVRPQRPLVRSIPVGPDNPRTVRACSGLPVRALLMGSSDVGRHGMSPRTTFSALSRASGGWGRSKVHTSYPEGLIKVPRMADCARPTSRRRIAFVPGPHPGPPPIPREGRASRAEPPDTARRRQGFARLGRRRPSGLPEGADLGTASGRRHRGGGGGRGRRGRVRGSRGAQARHRPDGPVHAGSLGHRRHEEDPRDPARPAGGDPHRARGRRRGAGRVGGGRVRLPRERASACRTSSWCCTKPPRPTSSAANRGALPRGAAARTAPPATPA